MVVLDASALLAILCHEPGYEQVQAALLDGAICGAANWSEVMQKTHQLGRNWTIARRMLVGYGLVIEPVTREDAEWAAACWADRPTLSLADRLCLALAHRLGVPALTADAAWGVSEVVRQIR